MATFERASAQVRPFTGPRGFRIRGLKKIITNFKKSKGRIEHNTVFAMRQAVELVRGRAQFNIRGTRASNPPSLLGRISGRLAGSLVGRVEGGTGGKTVQGFVGTRLIYAAVHEFGATIRARKAPFLVFKIGDKWIHTKSVRIPKRPYLVPALVWARPQIQELFRGGVTAALLTKGGQASA